MLKSAECADWATNEAQPEHNEGAPVARSARTAKGKAARRKGASAEKTKQLKQPKPKPPTKGDAPKTKANAAQRAIVADDDALNHRALKKAAFYSDSHSLVLNMDVAEALALLRETNVRVNCVVTSPPFYGQRDYGFAGQIGLEDHPAKFLERLSDAFNACGEVLTDNGSLWVNIGDTYWSGKGEHRSGEGKQGARRFGLRPQDRKGDGAWCRPKQLLLIPHRLAIAMQDAGWLVRNDNVWVKPNPIPDQVRDRCSMSHEYVFHFVRSRWYFFDKSKVGRKTAGGSILPPPDTWEVPPVRGRKPHSARFSEELVRIPILATTPPNGIVLDPFAGSGTSLLFAKKNGFRAIGIDKSRKFCELMAQQLSETSAATLFEPPPSRMKK